MNHRNPDFGWPRDPDVQFQTAAEFLHTDESPERRALDDLDAEVDVLFDHPDRAELPEGEQMFTCEIPPETLRVLPKESPFAKWNSGEIGYLPPVPAEGGPASALFSFSNEVSIDAGKGLIHRLIIAVNFAQRERFETSYAIADQIYKWDEQRDLSVVEIGALSPDERSMLLAVNQAFETERAQVDARDTLNHPPELSLEEINALADLVRLMSGEELLTDE